MLKKILPVFIVVIFILSTIAFVGAQNQTTEAQQSQKEQAVEAPVSAAEPSQPNQPSKEQPKEEIVKGIIKEIAPDASYVVINDTKIITTKEFLEDSYLEVGDNVEVTAEKTEQGLRAKSYNYIFEEETSAINPEENSTVTEGNAPQGY